jgi:error-prone DNA polymerase
LEQLAWSGACDSLTSGPLGAQERRLALWQLGMAARAQDSGEGSRPGSDGSVQLALPLELPQAPRLRKLGRWQKLIADYSTSGVTVGEHAMAILRPRLTVPKLVTSAQLAGMQSGSQVAVAGLVIARQRPGTAKGTMFLLFEDELGTINLIVAKAVYERHRHLARAEPLLLAKGVLECSQGVVNVIVRELAALESFLPGGVEGEDQAASTSVRRLRRDQRTQPPAEEELAQGSEVGSGMRAVAPPMQSFAMGRRR